MRRSEKTKSKHPLVSQPKNRAFSHTGRKVCQCALKVSGLHLGRLPLLQTPQVEATPPHHTRVMGTELAGLLRAFCPPSPQIVCSLIALKTILSNW